MTRRAVAVGVAGLLLLGLGPAASAAPTPVDTTQVSTAPVEDLILPVEDLVFGEGNADGSVVQQGQEFTLLSDVFFAYNQAALNPQASAEIERIVGTIKASGATALTVVGHTDSDGADAANLDLSRRRAESVRTALLTGLPGVTVTAEGRGEAEPVASNDTPEGRALNRRVTITRA